MAQIERAGSVSFGDASLSVWEEGISDARSRGGYEGAKKWEQQFKRDVFARIVHTLNRLGWTCTMPEINPLDIEHYGGSVARWAAERRRFCTKGDLKADLEIGGRHIELKMFQSVNCPTRPDYEGRYESDKEAAAPYVLRLEMERTRRRIRDYLCNVFSGYVFDTKHSSIYRKPLPQTAIEQIQRYYSESRHFKGDWQAELAKEASGVWYNRKTGDGALLEHEQKVWFTDRKGRWGEGVAYYADGMWWVAHGRYGLEKKNAGELRVTPPEHPRMKRNADLRRKRLEQELAKATKAMNFERAAVLRDILFPKNAELYVVRHKEHGAYHKAGFRGYTTDITEAGRFQVNEIGSHRCDLNEIIPLAEASA